MHVAPWLHEAGFNVLLFNWRAHGQSEGEVVTLGFNERYDLIAAVQFAKSKGAERVGVLGFSMGGTVAIATAAVYEDIDAVVADSPFVDVLSAVAGGLIERGLPEGLSFLLARLLVITACLRTQLNLVRHRSRAVDQSGGAAAAVVDVRRARRDRAQIRSRSDLRAGGRTQRSVARAGSRTPEYSHRAAR